MICCTAQSHPSLVVQVIVHWMTLVLSWLLSANLQVFSSLGEAHLIHPEFDSDLQYPQYPDPLLLRLIQFLSPLLSIYLVTDT